MVQTHATSEWMTPERYASLAETMTVRELRYQVGRPGFRTRAVNPGDNAVGRRGLSLGGGCGSVRPALECGDLPSRLRLKIRLVSMPRGGP